MAETPPWGGSGSRASGGASRTRSGLSRTRPNFCYLPIKETFYEPGIA
jgi:hypothetical protein